MDRARRRATRIRIKLGGRADMPEFIPPRPKGMWHSTYGRFKPRDRKGVCHTWDIGRAGL